MALFIINSLAGGGAERVMATLLHASAEWRDRYDISLALLDREDAAYAPPRWVDTIQFDCHGRLLPSVWAIRRLISRLQPDATLSFLTRANFANVGDGGPKNGLHYQRKGQHLGPFERRCRCDAGKDAGAGDLSPGGACHCRVRRRGAGSSAELCDPCRSDFRRRQSFRS